MTEMAARMNRRVIISVLSMFSCVFIKAQDVTMFPESTKVLKIEPSKTDTRITNANTPHFVAYNTNNTKGKLLLFIPGTNGIALRGPMNLFSTAVEEGYSVINISYINTPAIARICKDDNLNENADCAKDFRNRRVYGDTTFELIEDMPYDAIVNRLTKLLLYLKGHDKGGNWKRFIENGDLKWDEIALAGQSQGGGMSAFIAKTHLVYRVIDFSGGWDYSANGEIAKWYYKSSKTPIDRWFGTYHIKEPTAKIITKTYKAMKIPEDHIFAFDLDVPEGKRAHSNGIRNLDYKNQWITLLGKGN